MVSDARVDTDPATGPAEPARLGRWARLRALAARHAWSFLELFALTGLAIAQPVLDVFGRSPDFLLFRQADARDIALLAVTITVVPAGALLAVEAGTSLLGERVRRAVHLALIAGLLGLLGLEFAKKATPLRGPALVAVGVLAAAAGGLLYAKGPAVRLWLRFLAPAPIVFLALFLFVSPAAKLVIPKRVATVPPGAAQSGKQAPVVIIMLDEFPLSSILDAKGRVDRRLYPNLADLAGGSTWYRNATGVAGLTTWAAPAILTGRYPARDALPIAAEYPDNLFTLLDAHGYRMRVYEGVTQLCPPATCANTRSTAGSGGLRRVVRDSAQVLAQIAGPRDSAVDPTATLEEATVAEPRAAQPAAGAAPNQPRAQGSRPVSFQRFVSSIRRTDELTLHYVHVLMPHQPWKYLPSGRQYPPRTLGGKTKNNSWTTEPWPVQVSHQRLLMQVVYTDRLVGSVIKRLRDTGMYDRSLLVVTADHGMAFVPGENPRARATARTAPDVLWVPLFIKQPGQRTRSTSDVNWEHVDLVPTVAGSLGLQVPWQVDGVSWVDPSAAKRARTDKWFYPMPGGREVYDGRAGLAAALRGATDRLLRPDDGDLGWFKVGPHADLIGRRVDELTVAASGGSAQVVGLAEYSHVDLDKGPVPAHVGGRLTSTAPGTPKRPAVVVALNGVIGGVSETFAGADPATDPDPTWFSAMVPDSLMRAGGNRLELFLLDPAGGQPRLHPLALTG